MSDTGIGAVTGGGVSFNDTRLITPPSSPSSSSGLDGNISLLDAAKLSISGATSSGQGSVPGISTQFPSLSVNEASGLSGPSVSVSLSSGISQTNEGANRIEGGASRTLGSTGGASNIQHGASFAGQLNNNVNDDMAAIQAACSIYARNVA